MKNKISLILGLFVGAYFFGLTPIYAGGAFSTLPNGDPALLDAGQPVVWNFDNSPLKGPADEADGDGGGGGGAGCQLGKAIDIGNTQALEMVERAFKKWSDVPNSKLTIQKGQALLGGADVNISNIESVYSGSFALGTPTADVIADPSKCYDSDPTNDLGAPCNPIVFDHSGLVTQAILGTGAQTSVLGFAGILPKRANDAAGTILDKTVRSFQAVISGACLEPAVPGCPSGITLNEIEGTMTHELGHGLGLDHTLTNKDAYVDCCTGDNIDSVSKKSKCSAAKLEQIPTMIGLFCPGQDMTTLHQDDKATFAAFYPGASFNTNTCKITGIARRSIGSGGAVQRCLEVIARKGANATEANDLIIQDVERVNAVSTISGAFASRNSQGVVTNNRNDTDGRNAVNCNEADPKECGRFTIEGLEPGNYTISIQDFDAQPGVTATGTGENINFVLEPCEPCLASEDFQGSGGTLLPGYPDAAGMLDNPFSKLNVVCNAGATTDVGDTHMN